MNPLDIIAAAYWLAMSHEPSWLPPMLRGRPCSRCGGTDPGFWLVILLRDNQLVDARYTTTTREADRQITTLTNAFTAGWNP